VDYAVQSLDDLPPGFSPPEGRTKPWGTSQAILSAARAVSTPFAVMNADDFYGREAFAAMASFLAEVDPDAFDSAMVGYRIGNTLSAHGTVTRARAASMAVSRRDRRIPRSVTRRRRHRLSRR
jgi:hypothetical protein